MARLRSREELKERACVHCGHILGPYMIICDKCGSIQRHVKGDGEKIPPEKFGVCEICGQPVPYGETICAECAKEEEPVPIIIEPPKLSTKRKRIAALATLGTSGAGIAAGIVGVSVFEGVTSVILAAILGAGVLGLLASCTWLIILARRPSDEIVVYRSVYKGDEENPDVIREKTDLYP